MATLWAFLAVEALTDPELVTLNKTHISPWAMEASAQLSMKKTSFLQTGAKMKFSGIFDLMLGVAFLFSAPC